MKKKRSQKLNDDAFYEKKSKTQIIRDLYAVYETFYVNINAKSIF